MEVDVAEVDYEEVEVFGVVVLEGFFHDLVVLVSALSSCVVLDEIVDFFRNLLQFLDLGLYLDLEMDHLPSLK